MVLEMLEQRLKNKEYDLLRKYLDKIKLPYQLVLTPPPPYIMALKNQSMQ